MAGALILIVEDNPRNLKLIRDILQFRGYTTLEAETGEVGVTLARERQPALILMDVQLPGMDGRAATKALKADPSTQKIPVIAYHFPWPGIGHVAKRGERYRYVAVEMQTVL